MRRWNPDMILRTAGMFGRTLEASVLIVEMATWNLWILGLTLYMLVLTLETRMWALGVAP